MFFDEKPGKAFYKTLTIYIPPCATAKAKATRD